MKFRKWLMIAAFAVASALSFTLAACTDQGSGTGNGDPNHGGSSVVEGPESGVYYFGAGSDEYFVTLSGGNRFTLHMLGTDKSGTYEMEGNTITFDFLQDADGTASATLDGNVLTLSYQEGEWRFLKKVNYTVSFEEAGGTEIADVTVVNGRTFVRPADPEREGYRLIGWCTSAELDEFYSFETDTVTSDLTLYAYWAAYVPGQSEYTVSFDLGGTGRRADPSLHGGQRLVSGMGETRQEPFSRRRRRHSRQRQALARREKRQLVFAHRGGGSGRGDGKRVAGTRSGRGIRRALSAKQDAEGAFVRPFCMYCYIAARKQGKIIMADGRISGAEGWYQMKIIFKIPQTIDFPPRFCYTL